MTPAATDRMTWGVQRTDVGRGVTWITGTLAEVAARLRTDGGTWAVIAWRKATS